MNDKLKMCITFAPIRDDTAIDFEKVIDYIGSISDFELTAKESYRVEFSSMDKKRELLIHLDGMADLYMTMDDVKKDMPTLIIKGYELIKGLKKIDLSYRKEVGVMFSGKNAIKVYKDEEKRLKGSIKGILGDAELKETYISDTFSRVDYCASEILV